MMPLWPPERPLTETEYHVQEFEEGPGGGWWAMLQTSDLDEAKAYLAEQNSDEAVAKEIATYGFRARRRLMTVKLTPFEEPDHLRIALDKTLAGLIEMIPNRDDRETGAQSIRHLNWMIGECRTKLYVWPTDKTSRWIGWIQASLASKGLLDSDAERDRTRPFFHEAYKALGLSIPETVNP